MGRTSYLTLGEWPDIPVKKARAELAKRSGRAVPASALLVRDALSEWFQEIERNYRVTKNVKMYIDRASAEFGGKRLQELTRADVARFVRGYAKQAPVAANRCLTTIKLALGWCVEAGYLDVSPGTGLTRRIAGGDETSRSRVLGDAEIRALWRLESSNAKLLRGLLLSGCRIAELQRATHAHIDGDWLFIPAQHSKNGRAHHVYIVPELREQFDDTVTLFRRVSPTAVQAWVRRLQSDDNDRSPREPWASLRPIDKQTGKPMDAWTPHDLRRSFATRLGNLGIAPHVIEKCMNHVPQGVAGIYNRAELLEERIDATRRWAAELTRLVRA